MKPRDLQDLLVSDTLDLDAEFGLLGGGTSPLSLLSPNVKRASPVRTKPAVAAVQQLGCGAPRQVPPAGGAVAAAADEDMEDDDPLGDLPQFGRRFGGVRKPDPRRQSLAISSMFAAATAGAGLLGDSELAVGDEEIQVPLAKSGKLLGGMANHSTLWVEPDTQDLLDTELPSPLELGGIGGAGGMLATHCDSPILEEAQAAPAAGVAQPTQCDSPILQCSPVRSTRKAAAGTRGSAAFDDLNTACKGPGLDDFDSGDFQMQESNRVKELAILFKLEGASAGQRSVDTSTTSQAASRQGSPSASVSVSMDDGLADLRQRLQQISCGSASSSPRAAGAQVQQQQEVGAAASELELPAEQPGSVSPPASPAAMPALPQQEQQVAPPATAADHAEQEAAPAPDASSCPVSAEPALEPVPAKTEASASSAAAARKPAASRLPAPAARTSRLRPPTTSSGYFSQAATNSNSSRPAPRQGATAAHPAAAGSKSSSSMHPTTAGTTRAGSAAQAPAAGATAAKRPPAAAATSKAPAAAVSRLAQASSRIPTPSKPSAPAREAEAPAGQSGRSGGMFGQRTMNAAAARLRGTAAAATSQVPAGTPVAAAAAGRASRLAPVRGTPVSAVTAGLRRGSPGGSPADGAEMTPGTARLRWLEQNPDLAFGGGTKLAPSPQEDAQPARKLTAEERHMQEWQQGGHL